MKKAFVGLRALDFTTIRKLHKVMWREKGRALAINDTLPGATGQVRAPDLLRLLAFHPEDRAIVDRIAYDWPTDPPLHVNDHNMENRQCQLCATAKSQRSRSKAERRT